MRVDVPIVGDAANVLEDLLIAVWKAEGRKGSREKLAGWWKQIDGWRARQCLRYRPSDQIIKPQYAIERLYALTKDRDAYITTEVGQHQMWAAQFYRFEEPNRWMTSGGLGTMGYGLPAAVGVQMAHPKSLVIDIGGDASVQMTMQEMSTAIQFDLPIKIFILNNEWMGMVRQWQELLHGERYSHSYSDSLPDFVKLAEAYGGVGLRAESPGELDAKIMQMIETPKPVIFDCRVEKAENCFPDDRLRQSAQRHDARRRGRGPWLGRGRGGQAAGVIDAGRPMVVHVQRPTRKERDDHRAACLRLRHDAGHRGRDRGHIRCAGRQ